jgi:hypothetical protein
MVGRLRKNFVDRSPLTAGERVFRVAVLTSQRTARQTDKYRRQTTILGFALNREENLGDFQPRG